MRCDLVKMFFTEVFWNASASRRHDHSHTAPPPSTPGYAWRPEVVLALAPLFFHKLAQSDCRPLVLVEADLRKIRHYFPFKVFPLPFNSSFSSMYWNLREWAKRPQGPAFPSQVYLGMGRDKQTR